MNATQAKIIALKRLATTADWDAQTVDDEGLLGEQAPSADPGQLNTEAALKVRKALQAIAEELRRRVNRLGRPRK